MNFFFNFSFIVAVPVVIHLLPLSCLAQPHRVYRPSQTSATNRITNFNRKHLRRNNSSGMRRIQGSNIVTSCGMCCGYGPVITDVSSRYDFLDTSFYQKAIEVRGLVVAASTSTSDEALYEAALTIDTMTAKRPDILDILLNEGVHMTILGENQVTTDVPEYSNLNQDFPDSDWNNFRGIGPTTDIPVLSCAEENLLCLPGDPYSGENICVHETAHAILGSSLPTHRPYNNINNNNEIDLFSVVQEQYDISVKQMNLWENTYASSNSDELWAEGTQAYFNVDQEGIIDGDGVHNNINTRTELQSYDPDLYDILNNIYSSDTQSNIMICPATTGCDCSTFKCPSEMTDDNDNGGGDDGGGNENGSGGGNNSGSVLSTIISTFLDFFRGLFSFLFP